MSAKSQILNLRLDPEDKAWLEAQVEELGLDNVSAVMRSLIRRARKGALDHVPQSRNMVDESGLRATLEAEERARKEAERQRKAAELRRQLAALEGGEEPTEELPETHSDYAPDYAAEEFDVPPDPDGGNVTEFKPIPTGFKPPGSLARPAGAASGLVGDRSPAGESRRRNYHHLLPR